MPVSIFWDEISEGVYLPRFKKNITKEAA